MLVENQVKREEQMRPERKSISSQRWSRAVNRRLFPLHIPNKARGEHLKALNLHRKLTPVQHFLYKGAHVQQCGGVGVLGSTVGILSLWLHQGASWTVLLGIHFHTAEYGPAPGAGSRPRNLVQSFGRGAGARPRGGRGCPHPCKSSCSCASFTSLGSGNQKIFAAIAAF